MHMREIKYTKIVPRHSNKYAEQHEAFKHKLVN